MNAKIASKIYYNPEVKKAIFNIYKNTLESKDKDIKVIPADSDKGLTSFLRRNRGLGIPGDAKIVEKYQSIEIDDKHGFKRLPIFAR